MMVYVWTLSDPETRVKIQGDSRTRLSSPNAVPSRWSQGSSVLLGFWGGHPKGQVEPCLSLFSIKARGQPVVSICRTCAVAGPLLPSLSVSVCPGCFNTEPHGSWLKSSRVDLLPVLAAGTRGWVAGRPYQEAGFLRGPPLVGGLRSHDLSFPSRHLGLTGFHLSAQEKHNGASMHCTFF